MEKEILEKNKQYLKKLYFWWCYLVYKPKYQIWCESDVPCGQDPSIPN